MKKTLTLILALTLALALGAPALAANPTGGETDLTATIEETYTIVVPDDTAIVFEALSTDVGDIGLLTARLGPNRRVTFAADLAAAGAGVLTHANTIDTLAYTMKIDGAGASIVSFTAVDSKPVTIDITAAAWAAAKAGAYSDTITFTVACEDIVTP